VILKIKLLTSIKMGVNNSKIKEIVLESPSLLTASSSSSPDVQPLKNK